jgi:hypothetical protein
MLPAFNKVDHPSWRVYRALREVPQIKLSDYGLKEDADVYFPYEHMDDLTISIVRILMEDPDYDDSIFNIIPCLALFSDVDNRQILECALLKGHTIDSASEITGLPHDFILTYRSVFYDVGVIRNGDPGRFAYVSKGTYGKDAAAKRLCMQRGLEYMMADKGVSPAKVSIDDMMLSMMVQAFKLAKQKSESDERDDQMAAQSWAVILKNYASYFLNARKGKGGLTVEKLLLELKTTPPPQGVDTLD